MGLGFNATDTDVPLWADGLKVSANGEVRYKPYGFTMDWDSLTTAVDGATYTTAGVGYETDPAKDGVPSGLVTANDVTLRDGTVHKVGTKFVRYGTVIVEAPPITVDGEEQRLYRVADANTPLVRGKCFVMNYTITDQDPKSPNFGGAADEMRAFRPLLLVGGNGQPTVANFEAAFPNIKYAD